MPASYTIEKWLSGMVDYPVPDNAIASILYNNGVEPGKPMSEIKEKDKDMCLAGLYVWLATSSTTTSGELVADGGWQHQKSVRNVADRNAFLKMARRLYRKWNSPLADEISTGITMKNLY